MRLKFCVACGCNDIEMLQHHHLVPRAFGGPDHESNLITLCQSCHGKAHGYEAMNIGNLIKVSREKKMREIEEKYETQCKLEKQNEFIHKKYGDRILAIQKSRNLDADLKPIISDMIEDGCDDGQKVLALMHKIDFKYRGMATPRSINKIIDAVLIDNINNNARDRRPFTKPL